MTANLPPTLSPEEVSEIEAKVKDLEAKHKTKVFSCVMLRPVTNERVIAYIKEPDFRNKLILMDKASTLGAFQASDELRMLYLIREESHPLTYADSSEADTFKLGVVNFCTEMITMATDQLKKNQKPIESVTAPDTLTSK